MTDKTLNPLVMTYEPTPSGRKVTLNGVDLSWNVDKDGVEIAYDKERGAAIVTLRLVVDDLHVTGRNTEPIPIVTAPAAVQRAVREWEWRGLQ